MTIAQSLLQHPLLKPLGWTLVQFLWQGALAAALLAGLLLLLRRAGANTRYLAACAVFALLAACPAATLIVLNNTGESGLSHPASSRIAAVPGRSAAVEPSAAMA